MYKVALKECDETKNAGRFFQLHTVDNFLHTETARHAREQKVCQVSGYEWESNSEAESIKDVDDINMLLH